MNNVRHPVDTTIGQRIRIRRTELELSMEALGDAVGISYQQISKYERGTNRVTAGALFAISLALNAPIQYFFENTELVITIDDRETLELLKRYQAIKDPTNRKRLRDLAGALSETGTNEEMPT